MLFRSPGSVPALSLVGGGARSALWAQLLSSTLNLPLHTHTGGEAGGALGAARLAWLADLGQHGVAAADAEAAVCRTPPLARCFEPDVRQHEALMTRYGRFSALHPALQPLFG